MSDKKDFNHDIIVEKYKKLKLEHPEFDERQLLEEVFKSLSKDFIEDINAFPKTYYCNICKANHYFTSEIGKEHLAKSQKTLMAYKKKPEEIEQPKQKEEYIIPEKVRSRITGGLGAKVGTYMRIAERFLVDKKEISNESIQELIDKYGFGTNDIKQFIENFDRYKDSAKRIIKLRKEREEESREFQEKVKNQPVRNAEDVQSENDLIEDVSKYTVFKHVSRNELDILSKHDNKQEIFLVAGQGIIFTGDRYKIIVGADNVPKGSTIIHTHPMPIRGKLKGLASPFSPNDYLAFLTTDADRSIVFIQNGTGYMIEKTDNTSYSKIEQIIKKDLRNYQQQSAKDIVNEGKSADSAIFRFNRKICEKYNLKLQKFRWK